DIVSRNILTFYTSSPFVTVTVVMIAVIGPWSGPTCTTLFNRLTRIESRDGIPLRGRLHQGVRLGLGLTAVGAFGLAENHKGCVWVSRNALRVRLVVQERTKGAFGCAETPTRPSGVFGFVVNNIFESVWIWDKNC
nr:hypothetical protein [Tanacetum cinerariifolium]